MLAFELNQKRNSLAIYVAKNIFNVTSIAIGL